MPLDLTPQSPPYYTIDENLPDPADAAIAAIYRAEITQTGTAAPVATTNINNTLTAVVWSRTNAGQYFATKTAAFPANKTYITTTPQGEGQVANIQVWRVNDNEIGVVTFDTNTLTAADDLLQKWNITITITI